MIEIHPIDEIRGKKTFPIAFNKTIAQIRLTSHLKVINNSIIRSHALACNVHPKHVDINQFTFWSGIAAPIDKWEFLSFSFLLKRKYLSFCPNDLLVPHIFKSKARLRD